MTLIFKQPTPDDKQAVLAFKEAYLSYYDETGIHGGAELAQFDKSNFDQWLDYVYAPAGTNTFGYDKVANDTFLIIKNDIVVGIVNIRHELTEFLLQFGGHIGYSTHPDFQGQGIAKNALAYALSVLKNKGVNKALITCNDNNIGSAKVIEANGGILENTVPFGEKTIRRYWILL
ncbi:GNAT family N-acetyltransferase [Moraxella nasibovis]|uniref:GNAT family N-acetyltransferase n=1 Tax=Moraxella nasibovis TaxID=2904120 RepID=UPI0024105215|nr:GNAT family N-acetyltransferase [Moraxella nasibovis]WFF39186.1 GNAT family N-acetyltransferase [Moraxella nasibovis]